MKKYLRCLRYIFLHKWHVYHEARALGLGFWQSAMHDMSKLGWLEFEAYTTHFYTDDKSEAAKYRFDVAWLHHIHNNPHHWQYWILRTDSEGIKVLRMPEKYVKEMVADWRGVAAALGKGRAHAVTWYLTNKDSMALHPQTRSRVETLLGVKEPDNYQQTVSFPIPREVGT